VGAESVVAPSLTVRQRAVFGTAADAVPATIPSRYYYEPDPAPTVEPAELLDGGSRSSLVYPVLKGALDLTAAVLGLLLLSPLFFLIAALIRLESKGAVFFRDWREGKGGRVFECLKFRTMFLGAAAQQRELAARNQVDGPQFKIDSDPRVTRLGRLLRATNLDELPQLINVLFGDMSLVGPRPSPFRENQLCIPWRHGRLSVRPGITGLWQICRNHREAGDFHQWIHYDLLYVRHRSFAVDLKIVLFTLLSLGGHWPVPLTWIVSPRHMEAAPPIPLAAKA
jgi:lipopolysaccharide/colanic/teichoic acid biosynthesis glycosyltransferase